MINVDKLSYSANSYNVKNFKKNRNYLFYKTDINKTSKILQILNKHKPIGIFNLAAETHVDRSIDKAHHFIRSNIVGVYSLLEAIRKFENNKVKKLNFYRFLLMKFMVIYQKIKKQMKIIIIIPALHIQPQKLQLINL